MMKTMAVFRLAIAGVLVAATSWAAFLENPGGGRLYSGIGVISGWKCEAEGDLTIVFNNDGQHIPLLYGAERADVLEAGACASAEVGFVTIWNWGNLGDGEHEAVAYDNGVEFSRSTFTVGSTGEEFLQGVTRQHLLENFPSPGETTILEWNESTQHFEIRGMLDSPMEGEYDLAYWRQLSRDLSEGTYRTAEFLYDEEPDVDACYPGRLSQAAKNRALKAMNRIRALHSLPPVQYSSRYDEQVQAAALIHASGGRGHYPPPTTRCYTEMGAEGSRTSNLWALAGPGSVMEHLMAWTSDADNTSLVAAAGHRRWVLNPFATYVSYGQVRNLVNLSSGTWLVSFAALKVHSFHDAPPLPPPRGLVEYVAFPYETYPFHLVEGDPPWSFSVVEDKLNIWANRHPYFENAGIRVVRTADAASLVITDRYTESGGAGVPNLLSWQVEGWEYDTLYEVEISNVTLQNGETRSYSYPVFIERANIEY